MYPPQLAGERLKDSEDTLVEGLERIGATRRGEDAIDSPAPPLCS
jgi:hypothetical protein